MFRIKFFVKSNFNLKRFRVEVSTCPTESADCQIELNSIIDELQSPLVNSLSIIIDEKSRTTNVQKEV